MPQKVRFWSMVRESKRVEMLFAHLKRILRLGVCDYARPCGAQFEFALAATCIIGNLCRSI
jgi:hypothetical protein